MKKTVLFLSALLTMVSCHYFKPVDGPGMVRVDSTAVEQDSLVVADSEEATPPEASSETDVERTE